MLLKNDREVLERLVNGWFVSHAECEMARRVLVMAEGYRLDNERWKKALAEKDEAIGAAVDLMRQDQERRIKAEGDLRTANFMLEESEKDRHGLQLEAEGYLAEARRLQDRLTEEAQSRLESDLETDRSLKENLGKLHTCISRKDDEIGSLTRQLRESQRVYADVLGELRSCKDALSNKIAAINRLRTEVGKIRHSLDEV